ncbi:50S ribosomal protein L31E [Nanobdella aerobiophila]|uniref:Large ribosomal subunit protein eL31 n=1 Tax=Nanobdella aerobiophila TaxID=2586965 RepID=A0A915WRM1_9ARCH|nr:60S ribosomal protein L31 [Nanobdella aerobiophila]BBL45384.1 50S ribosomal protein L31E [Nanobdella aerobiophila]
MPEETVQLEKQENVQETPQQEQPKEEKIEEYKIKINIRKYLLRASLFKRAKKAASTIKRIMKVRYKNENIKLSKRLNEYIWSRGIKNPPAIYKLRIIKKEDTIYVDLDE